LSIANHYHLVIVTITNAKTSSEINSMISYLIIVIKHIVMSRGHS